MDNSRAGQGIYIQDEPEIFCSTRKYRSTQKTTTANKELLRYVNVTQGLLKELLLAKTGRI